MLWNLHKVHHSTLELDGFATTRTHMLENLLRFVPGQAVLFALGMPVATVALTVAIAAIYGVSNHSNLDIRANWLEAVLVTPRLHRRHHVPSTTQTNYGAILTIWDRLFGTLTRQDTLPDERYGVPGEIDTYPQPFAQAVRQPFRQILALRASRSGAPTAGHRADHGGQDEPAEQDLHGTDLLRVLVRIMDPLGVEPEDQEEMQGIGAPSGQSPGDGSTTPSS
jgi:hypothetical protein